MKYILINPVVAAMYPRESLEAYLSARGYTRVDIRENWSEIVLARYRALLEKSDATIADARCPMAVDLFHKIAPQKQIQLAPLEPILICCAREICQREDLADGEKVITTPCRALADMGNRLQLRGARFVSWKHFVGERAEPCPQISLAESPIPPGYFSGLPYPVRSVTGRDALIRALRSEDSERVRLIEMLYCQDGCHRGDGVIWRDENNGR